MWKLYTRGHFKTKGRSAARFRLGSGGRSEKGISTEARWDFSVEDET
jgi:hypothetical protein